jgi:hypothetical protein
MSTKNLARTVIEGGRTGHSKYLRRSSSRWLRIDYRRFCKKMAADQESWDNTPLPLRSRDWDDIEHADKTNPCERFLISRAGKPWDNVRSEIFRRFDRKTLAGRHIIFDHLIDKVEDQSIIYHCYRTWGFWVDKGGILRYKPRTPWKRYI